MSQILVGTQKSPFSPDRFPITPDTMGAFTKLKELFVKLFKHLENPDLANFALVNWTCKEVVERNTEWGERKRVFRILPGLFKNVSVQDSLKVQQIWVETEVTRHIYDLHPGNDVGITRNLEINNVLMSTYSISSLFGSSGPSMTFFYKVDREDSPPRRQEEYCYQLYENKLQKMTFSNPPTLMKDLDLSQQTQSSAVVGFAGSRLLVWHNRFDATDPNNKFCTLQAINRETLQIETSHHFYPLTEAPLPRDITHTYLDEKFCIVIGTESCAIKMGKSTLRINQEILKRLLGMRIDQVSIQNRPKGQMMVTLKGLKGRQDICMQHTADPFDPLDRPAVGSNT